MEESARSEMTILEPCCCRSRAGYLGNGKKGCLQYNDMVEVVLLERLHMIFLFQSGSMSRLISVDVLYYQLASVIHLR